MRTATIRIAVLASSLAGACGSSTPPPVKSEAAPAAAADSAAASAAQGVAAPTDTTQLANAAESLDAVGRAIVEQLNANDTKALLELGVTGKEYLALYGALRNDPRDKRNALQLAFADISGVSRSAVAAMVTKYGGKSLTFVSLATTGHTARTGLVEHDGATLTVKTADGAEASIGPLGTIVEHQASGKFKLVGFGPMR